ncbi:MAG TPA: lycopene cyclase domain-containing protein [Candidatus Portnoybacteria bacterium]|nr:lycopene cyclase domain-containing protein [Candidatus Portnoybacteria bacterium]
MPLLPYKYAYLFCCLILAVFWLLIFARRKDLRREMVWASLAGLPFGIIDYFLVPAYWHPESLFGLMEKYGVGIESFLFLFLMAGLVSVIYEFLSNRKTKKINGSRSRHLHLLPLLLGVICFFTLTFLFPNKAIYNFIAAGALGGLAVVWLRRDLFKQAAASALIFTLFYFGVLLLVNQIFSGVIASVYNFKNMCGILVLGIPLEELLAAFFAGGSWSVFYEYVKSYREERLG